MNLLLSAAALLIASNSGAKSPGTEFFVQTDKGVTVEKLAAAVRPFGRIESRDRYSRRYLIQLNAGVDDDVAKERLQKISGVHALTAPEEPVDMNSMRSVNRKIAHMTEGEKGEGGKDAGVDYLEAYRYFMGLRAFTDDSFDWTILDRARAHAHKMPPTRFPKAPQFAGIASPGQEWKFIGPTNLETPPDMFCFGIGPCNGRVNAVAFDPQNAFVIYAGGAAGGLWKSTDAGDTWAWCSSNWPQLAVNCIAIDPTNTNTIYVGLGDFHGSLPGSYGIMKSTDGGITWNEIATSSMGQVSVNSLLIDPVKPSVLLAGSYAFSGGNLYRSIDGGKSWTPTISSQSGDSLLLSALSSTVSNGKATLYALLGGTYAASSPSRLMISTDDGATWHPSPGPLSPNNQYLPALCLAISPTNPKNLYILDSQDQALYVSTDGGLNWVDESANLPTGGTLFKIPTYNFSQSTYDYHLTCGTHVKGNTKSDALYLGEIDLQESLDQGKTWQSIGGPTWLPPSQGGITHNDQHAMAICPTDPNLALFSNDGGVYQLNYNLASGLNSVKSLNQGLGNTMFYKIACHPTNASTVMGGAQDNATPFTSDLYNWLNCTSGDGGGCAINQSNPSIAYGTAENLYMYRTTDGWKTSSYINPPLQAGEVAPFVATVVIDPSNPNLMYTGTNFLYRWDESTQTWGADVGNTDFSYGYGGQILAIAFAPSDSRFIYVGTASSYISMSTDHGGTFIQLPNPVLAPISSISVSPSNASDILIGYSYHGVSHLYRCPNTTSKSSIVFQNVSGSGITSLPDASLNAIARDIDDPENTWYVATDVGIFQTTNAGTTWSNTSYMYGLPDVVINDLVAVPGTRYLNAGTYGRGMWHLPLPVGGINLTSFTVSANQAVLGGTVTGTVTISKPAPKGGTAIDIQANAPLSYPSAVVVQAGQTTATFQITVPNNLSQSIATIYASQLSIVKSQEIQIVPIGLQMVQVNPGTVQGGSQASVYVTLNGPAPAAGMKVNLKSDQSSLKLPLFVTVPAGATSASTTVVSVPVAADFTANITGSDGNNTAKSKLTVLAAKLVGVSVDVPTVVGGSTNGLGGSVTLSGPTPDAGLTVKLGTTNSAAATVPASILVKLYGSQTTAHFIVTHYVVKSSQGLAVTATLGSQYYTANLVVQPFAVVKMSVNPSFVSGGNSTVGTVQLNAAPNTKTRSQPVQLSTTQTYIGIPKYVLVGAGKPYATFPITTKPVTGDATAAIDGTLGTSLQQAFVNVLAAKLLSIKVSPTSFVGKADTRVTAVITLGAPAPSGGAVIVLTNTSPSAVSLPASVTIPAGQTSTLMNLAHYAVSRQTTVTLKASFGGTIVSTTVVVKP